MESLAEIVAASFARHGIECPSDIPVPVRSDAATLVQAPTPRPAAPPEISKHGLTGKFSPRSGG